jgi:hypothetical protein
MKRLITLLIILFCVNVQAQVSVKDADNSTTTTLDSAATYTGSVRLVAGWNSISVTVLSDSAGTLQVQFGNKETNGSFTALKTYNESYGANELNFTKNYSIDAPYYRVLFTSSADTQHTFILTTMLHQNFVIPFEPITTISNAVSAATDYFGETDTVTTRVDTFSIDVDYWVEGEIKADDSIEVCIDGAFTAGKTFIITETTAVTLPRWGDQSTTALYIRRYGGAGTPRYYIRLHGR